MVLVVVYAALAALLVVAAVDVSVAFLARRQLAGLADGAALAGAQALDRPAFYTGGAAGATLPVAADGVQAAVTGYLTASGEAQRMPGLTVELAPPAGGTVTLTLRRPVRLPFLGVLRFAGAGAGGVADGALTVAVTASARSPLVP